MKYFFFAVFVLLLDVCTSLDVDVPCTKSSDCQNLTNAPTNVTCSSGYCMCTNEIGTIESCAGLLNITSLPETHLISDQLIGRKCSLDNECNTTTNAYCNTTTKQCDCEIGYIASLNNQQCLPAIQYNNSGCEITNQCLYSARNTICSNGTCICDVNHHYASGVCWRSIGFGLNCSATEECSLIQDAICGDQNLCGCPINKVIGPNSTACLSLATKIEDNNCIESIQCFNLMGEKSVCVDHRCQCHEYYHYSPNVTKCIPNLDMGSNCQFDYQCSNGEKEQSVHGALRCFEKKCTCFEGFKNLNGKCEKSAGNRIGDVSAFVIALTYFTFFVL